MHTQQQEFLLEANFADSTPKFKGFELNLKVFCTFLSDIYNWFDKVFISFFQLHIVWLYSSIVYTP